MFKVNVQKRWKLISCTFILCVLLTGCWRESFDSYTDFDAVITIYDEEFDFALGRDEPTSVTYFMPEKVFDLAEDIDDSVPVGDKYDEVILERVAEDLAKFGYLRVADPDDAEVEVEVGKVAQDNWVYYNGYWCCGWYWYYPYYGTSVNYPSGSVVIGMTDPTQEDEEEQRKYVVWSAGIRGLIDYQNASSVRNAIDQAFKQSADYLKIGDPVGPGEKPDDDPDAGME
jgi:hypothetical protein